MKDKLEKELTNLANQKDQTQLRNRLKEIILDKTIDENELLKFLAFTWQANNKYIVFPETINGIGVDLRKAGLDPKNDSLLQLGCKLYRLAAERGDAWGKSNYAKTLYYGWLGPKDLNNALKYAQEAIDAKLDFMLLKAEILWDLKKYQDSIIVYSAVTKDGKENVDWQKSKNKLDVIVAKFLTDFQEHNNKKLKINIERAEAILKFDDQALQNQCCYFLGLAYIELKDYQKAMPHLIKIPAEDKHYVLSIPLQKNCYLQQGRKVLGLMDPEEPASDAAHQMLEEGQAEVKTTELPIADPEQKEGKQVEDALQTVSFPDGTKAKVSFRAAWKKSNNDFDVARQNTLSEINNAWEASFDATEAALKTQKLALKKYQTLKNHGALLESEEIKLQLDIKKLDDQTSALQTDRDKYQQHYKSYSLQPRKRLRRAKAEEHFFDPCRTTKKKELFELYGTILDARFVTPTPDSKEAKETKENKIVTLTNRSSRQALMAERLFHFHVRL